MHSIGTKPVIKIRKNASAERCRGSKYRRRAIRDYQEKGYKTWADQNQYGMRWPGTEGIFSPVKRKFGENCMSRSSQGLEAEGYQRFWLYDYISRRAKRMVKAMELSGHFKIFFTMLALREKYRGTSSIHLLYHSFLKVVEELAAQGIFFEEISANAYTPAGIAVCKSFGMKYVRDSPSKGKIFSMNFYPFPKSTVFSEHPVLNDLYKKEFG